MLTRLAGAGVCPDLGAACQALLRDVRVVRQVVRKAKWCFVKRRNLQDIDNVTSDGSQARHIDPRHHRIVRQLRQRELAAASTGSHLVTDANRRREFSNSMLHKFEI
jgi:hypothetical protein